jgi:ABC-type bacteriocin/lantibiotic exporter with double-glycine peptidase domain
MHLLPGTVLRRMRARNGRERRRIVAQSKPEPVSEPKEVKEETLFKLKQIDFKVPRGQLLAIVGAVGSGKTSLIQGLIGDMRKTEGSVRFRWILGVLFAECLDPGQFPVQNYRNSNGLKNFLQNATIRENICFGRPFEAERYWKAVHDACLEADLDVLPNGDMTEVGERVRGGLICSWSAVVTHEP